MKLGKAGSTNETEIENLFADFFQRYTFVTMLRIQIKIRKIDIRIMIL